MFPSAVSGLSKSAIQATEGSDVLRRRAVEGRLQQQQQQQQKQFGGRRSVESAAARKRTVN
eukprot:4136281-Alexandrium_andersonii.AAC.1